MTGEGSATPCVIPERAKRVSGTQGPRTARPHPCTSHPAFPERRAQRGCPGPFPSHAKKTRPTVPKRGRRGGNAVGMAHARTRRPSPAVTPGVRQVRGALAGSPGAGTIRLREAAVDTPPWKPRQASRDPCGSPGPPGRPRVTAFFARITRFQRSSRDVIAGGSSGPLGQAMHQHAASCQVAVSLPRRLLLAVIPSRARRPH
jgi:hypothetical protein